MTSHEWIVLLFSNFSLAFHKTLKNLILILFIGLSLSACTSFSIADQPKSSGSITLDGEGNIGQTFVARFDGLAAIGLSIQTSSSSEGDLKLVVHSSPQDNQNLREAVLPLSAVNNNGFTYFYFPPLVSSNNQSYYFNLKFIGNGQVFVGISDGNTYINGALTALNDYNNYNSLNQRHKCIEYLDKSLELTQGYGEALGLKLEVFMMDFLRTKDAEKKQESRSNALKVIDGIMNSESMAPAYETLSRLERDVQNRGFNKYVAALFKELPNEMEALMNYANEGAKLLKIKPFDINDFMV